MPEPMDLILWLDMETTGLNRERTEILEVGAILTDRKLNTIDERSWLNQWLPPIAMNGLDPDVVEMHAANGLWRALHETLQPMTEGAFRRDYVPDPTDPLAPPRPRADAHFDDRISGWLAPFIHNRCQPGGDPRVILGGAGVSHFDSQIIQLRLPKLAALLHHRTMDISVVRQFYELEVVFRISDESSIHRALPDCRAAIGRAEALLGMLRLNTTSTGHPAEGPAAWFSRDREPLSPEQGEPET